MVTFNVSIILFLRIKYYTDFIVITAEDCGPNEVNVDCERPITCQPSCDNPNGTSCSTFRCSEGCHCKDGFIRASHTDMTCIRMDQCNNSEYIHSYSKTNV